MLSFSSFVWHDTVLQVRQFAEFKDWRCVNLKLIIKKLTLPQFEFQKYLVILFWTFVMWFSFSAFFKFWNPFCEMATIIEKPLWFQKSMVLKVYEVKHYCYHSSFWKNNSVYAVVVISENFPWNCIYSLEFQNSINFQKIDGFRN